MRAHDAGQGTSLTAHRSPRQARFWSAVGYSMMVLGTIGAFLLIRGYGERLMAPPAAPVASSVAATAQPAQVLVHSLWRSHQSSLPAKPSPDCLPMRSASGHRRSGCRHFSGTFVVGVGAVGLHPPTLGRALPGRHCSARRDPVHVPGRAGPQLSRLTHASHATVATSHASILAPFLLGSLLALGLYPRLSTAACRSPVSLCLWAWRCRSLPSPCWRES